MRVRLCGAFEGSKVGLQVAFPHSAATQEGTCTPAASRSTCLLVQRSTAGSRSRSLAWQPTRFGTQASPALIYSFLCLVTIMQSWQSGKKCHAFLTKPVLKALLTSLVPQKYFFLVKAALMMKTMMMMRDIGQQGGDRSG